MRGVQFIHSQRILHLDLKPFNIMFANPDDNYNLRIIDFGLSENLEDADDGQVKMTKILDTNTNTNTGEDDNVWHPRVHESGGDGL